MSDLLNQASLVMVPSGYKEDTVYSVVPSDGSGDLAFTRASNGTRINSAGLVEDCPWNLASYSEDFTNGWPVTATITANTTTNPINGATNADTITGTGYVGRNIASVGVNTFFVYAKANSASVIRLNVYDGATDRGADYNLTTGAISGVYGSPISTNAESVGNGWWKISITTNNANYSNVQIHRDSTGTCYIWGAQLNIGSTAKPYFPTTDRLNVPRLTYQNGGGGCPSLLLEKQSTNVVTYSEQFDNAAWTKLNSTITANSVTSPDGTQNADTITDNTTNGAHYTYQFGTQTTGTAWTCYMKKGSLDYGFIGAVQSSAFRTTAIINLTNGAIVELQNGSSTTGTVTAEDCGNGWYRVKMQTNANGAGYSVGTSNGAALSGANKEAIYTGTGSGTIYLWGAQLEDSAYATSYIQSTSSSATRVADACSKTGISSLIGQTSGALFIEFNSSFFESYTQRIFTLSDGTTSNVIGFQLTGANELVFYVENGGTNQVVINKATPAITLGSNVKIAAAYANNDFVFYVNGTQIGTDTSGSVPATSQLRFSEANASAFYLGLIKQVCLFPTRLTNAELASLTTI